MKINFLLLIGLLFQLSLSAQEIHGGMENWRNYSSGFPFPTVKLEAPQGWYGLDSLVVVGVQLLQLSGSGGNAQPQQQVFKSSDSRSGTHAAMLVTREMDSLGVVPGVLSNARINVDIAAIMGGGDMMEAIDYTGGTEIYNRVNGINAWVKYEPSGADSATIFVAAAISGIGANGGDSLIAAGFTAIEATNGYIAVSTPLVYLDSTSVPDKLIVGFSSSSSDAGSDGSTLYIDDVTITGATGTDISMMHTETQLLYFPNPSNGVIHLRGPAQLMTWTAWDLSGRKVCQTTWEGMGTADCSTNPSGTYLYRITNEKGATMQTGHFVIL